MRNLIGALKAMSDEQRMNILVVLTLRGAVCVSHLQEAMKAPQPTVSRYLSILRNAGLLDAERRGQWVYYKLNDEEGEIIVEMVKKTALRLKDSSKIKKIMDRLDKIEQQPALPESEQAAEAEAKKKAAAAKPQDRSTNRKPPMKEDGPVSATSIPDGHVEVQTKEELKAEETLRPQEKPIESKIVEAVETKDQAAVKEEGAKPKRQKKVQPPSLFDL